MEQRMMTGCLIESFEKHLEENEKAEATMQKYMRDIRFFADFVSKRPLNKKEILRYKEMLETEYAVRSANSMLAALNAFFRFAGWQEFCVKQFKVQREAFISEEKELTKREYLSLVQTAEKKKNERLSLLIQTICATGIRVSELESITVEAARRGEAVVNCKGKTRKIFLVKALQRKLLRYAERTGRASGAIFVTKRGRAMNRSNIWREMKALCRDAGISPKKVFPHNLRHLFARIFYGIEKDIAKLADILGHSNINTTRIYIMTDGAEHRSRMEHMHLIL